MRDISKRLLRLEEILGDRRCVCERNKEGHRFFVSVVAADAEAAQLRFDACRAVHSANDQAVIVLVHAHSAEGLARGRTGVSPTHGGAHGNGCNP